MATLPNIASDFNPTRDYLQDVCLAMSSLQRGFLSKHPRDWQYGLEVTMRGISTQEFEVNGEKTRVLLDLVKNKVRMDGVWWPLEEYSGAEIFKNFKVWLESKNASVKLDEPEFAGGRFDQEQAHNYAEALWWMYEQFEAISKEFKTGVTAPIFLYAHHFDLALVWFPWDDERQIGIGFSTGDETIPEPYIYLTIYPESKDFADIKIPEGAHLQKEGFSGLVLPYKALQESDDPGTLLHSFVGPTVSYIISGNLFG
jgi:hypothetical protein